MSCMYVGACGMGLAYLRGGIGRRSIRSGMAIKIRFVKMFVCDMDQSQGSPGKISELTTSVTITAIGCKLSVIEIGRESICIPLSV
jgi:hypothetical protein